VTSDDKWWTSGFFPGSLWYLYEYSKSDKVRLAAIDMTNRVANQQYTTDNHDVGFMIYCSFGNAYRLTCEKSYEKIIVNAAKSLSTRFVPSTGCIRSWDSGKSNWQQIVIIDNMMNLELLTNATKISGDSSFYKIAISHADTTMKYHFRPNASSYHVLDYDTIVGGAIKRVTKQGAFDESSWARGQGWALYGYSMMYNETKKTEYLNQAIKIANFIMSHPNLPEDNIMYWDFDTPEIPNALRDASAAAIIASAMVELSTFVDGNLSKKYLSFAEKTIRSLASPAYLADLGSNGNFILKHSVGYMGGNSEIDVPLTYADYYFIEAMIRYRELLIKKSH
jgi:rhamnogalacturonyl hydrolase YesR